MRHPQFLVFGLVVVSGALALGGCFKRSITTPNGTVDVSNDGNTVNVATDEGTATFSQTASLPTGFPSDVPTPTVGTITSSYSGSDTTNAGFTVMYSLSAAEAVSASQQYQAQLKADDFAIEGTASTNAGDTKLDVFTAKKGSIQVGVTVSTTSDGTATMNLAVTTGNAQ